MSLARSLLVSQGLRHLQHSCVASGGFDATPLEAFVLLWLADDSKNEDGQDALLACKDGSASREA